MRAVCIFILTLFSSLSYSQDTKKVILKKNNSPVTEEFFVLKSDKSVKHGNYVKYSERLAVEKYYQEFGYFDHDKKNGAWFYFNAIHPQNPISVVGEYKENQKTGQWAYFYPAEIKDTSVLNLLGFKKSTDLFSSKDDLQIIIDTAGLKLAAIGNFDQDRKTGEWRYFSREGRLIKIYDFSQKKQVYSFRNDSIDLYLLGGFYNFQTELSQSIFENSTDLNSLSGSEASMEIITNGGNLFVNNLTPFGDNQFASCIESALKSMSLFWIDFDPTFEKFSFTIKLNLNRKERVTSLNFESVNPKFE